MGIVGPNVPKTSVEIGRIAQLGERTMALEYIPVSHGEGDIKCVSFEGLGVPEILRGQYAQV